MLVDLGLVEQRLKAVNEVLDGATVIDVAKRNGVTRQTVHAWLRRFASAGVAGLVDKTSKLESCLHQMTAVVEARIVEMRRAHPAWGREPFAAAWPERTSRRFAALTNPNPSECYFRRSIHRSWVGLPTAPCSRNSAISNPTSHHVRST